MVFIMFLLPRLIHLPEVKLSLSLEIYIFFFLVRDLLHVLQIKLSKLSFPFPCSSAPSCSASFSCACVPTLLQSGYPCSLCGTSRCMTYPTAGGLRLPPCFTHPSHPPFWPLSLCFFTWKKRQSPPSTQTGLSYFFCALVRTGVLSHDLMRFF